MIQLFCSSLTMPACTDLSCLSDRQWSCSASSLLLEKPVHFVLQLLIALEQVAELPANFSCMTGESWSVFIPIEALTIALFLLTLDLGAAGQLWGQTQHHVLQHASQVIQLRSEGTEHVKMMYAHITLAGFRASQQSFIWIIILI